MNNWRTYVVTTRETIERTYLVKAQSRKHVRTRMDKQENRDRFNIDVFYPGDEEIQRIEEAST